MPLVTVETADTLPTLAPSSPATAAFDPGAAAHDELRRQVQVYVDMGLPELLGTEESAFREVLAPLATRLPDLDLARPGDVPADDHVPFVLVLASDALRVNDLVPAMRRGTRPGVSVIDEDEARTYRPLDAVTVPPGFAYLLGGVEVGARYVNVTPEDALADLAGRGRTPLTIAEGLALVITRPDMLRPNRCFSLAGSRTGTNQRVPAIWISQRRPKLGWCWDRNPHTWLGTASALVRAGAGG
ncbi:DUF5701 family protein [Georgenia thermotolerans]|uniref:DUF5701 family protein n=1 Tax=Georgenia thermotolerans TaxID=527326 RepID=UPI001B8B4DF2|nr:DUF5701 family protein [Georgenia thermotolerans]